MLTLAFNQNFPTKVLIRDFRQKEKIKTIRKHFLGKPQWQAATAVVNVIKKEAELTEAPALLTRQQTRHSLELSHSQSSAEGAETSCLVRVRPIKTYTVTRSKKQAKYTTNTKKVHEQKHIITKTARKQ